MSLTTPLNEIVFGNFLGKIHENGLIAQKSKTQQRKIAKLRVNLSYTERIIHSVFGWYFCCLIANWSNYILTRKNGYNQQLIPCLSNCSSIIPLYAMTEFNR